MSALVSLACIGKICTGAATIYGAVSSGQAIEKVGEIFEALRQGKAGADGLFRSESDILKDALRSAETKLRLAYAESFKVTHSAGFEVMVATAFDNLGEVFETCLPRGQALAALNLDARRIGEAIADAAVARKIDVFREGEGRKLLIGLVVLAFAELDAKPKFMEALSRLNWQEAFERLGQIDAKLDALPDALMRKMLAVFETREEARRAEQAGIERQAIILLAKRIRHVETVEEALRELENVVEVAICVQNEGRLGTNSGSFVDEVLRRVAALTAKGRSEDAIKVADAAFVQWEMEEQERRDAARQAGLKLLDASIGQALLLRDAAGAAARIARKVELESDDPQTRVAVLWSAQQEWYERGRDAGLKLDLEVAIEIGRLVVAAVGIDEQGPPLIDLGSTLFTLGERESGVARLEEALAVLHVALDKLPRSKVPLLWAAAMSNRANVLLELGQRESGTTRLEKALSARRSALEELKHDLASRGKALLGLGNVLFALGNRESGTERLKEAVSAFHAALDALSRDDMPLDWATAQNNLGNVLFELGERDSETVWLEEARTAYCAALEERRRELVPLDWAMTQNNLGNVLQTLGQRELGTARLEEAVSAHRLALEERRRDLVPLDWATAQDCLGTALAILGERESGTARLKEAVSTYRAALEERPRDCVPLDWAMTQHNLGQALQILGDRENETSRLIEAMSAFRAALGELPRDRLPLLWAMVQSSLGNALLRLGQRDEGTALPEAAVSAYSASLEEYTSDSTPHDWASAQNNLGTALSILGKRESGTARLEEAAIAYRAASEVWTRESAPHYWDMAQQGLAETLALIQERGGAAGI